VLRFVGVNQGRQRIKAITIRTGTSSSGATCRDAVMLD